MVGELARLTGDDELALASYERSCDAARELGDRFMLSIDQLNMSHIYVRRGRIEEAAAAVDEAIDGLLIFNNRWALAWALSSFAGVAIARGDVRTAVGLLAASNAWSEQNGVVIEPQDKMEYDRYVAAARAALSPQEFSALWDAGSTVSLEEAVVRARPSRHVSVQRSGAGS
jgi:hypothetical protein